MAKVSATEVQKAALRANDIATCNNLMSLHAWYHASFLNSVELEKCWVKSPENAKTAVWAQNAGYWIGMDNIKAYYGPVTPRDTTKAQFQFHTISSGIVEIADDRKTAKGVWYTPGAIGKYPNVSGMWERYGIDFLMENGEWKIWHLHVYTDFTHPLMGSGMQMGPPPGEKAEKFGAEAGGGTGRPMVPAQANADPGYTEFGNNYYPDLIPRPPEPYKTFSETWSYGDPNEVKMFSGPYREWSEIKKKK